GIVPSLVDGVRQLPGKAVQLPVLAVSSALTALEVARKEYDALADRGGQLIDRLRGHSVDELEDRVEDALRGTPLEHAYETVESAVETVQSEVETVGDTVGDGLVAVTDLFAGSRDTGAEIVPEDEAPKREPTPAAPHGNPARVDSAATPDVVETVEEAVEASTAPAETAHEDLPLADYDHMTLGALRGRMRSLTVDQLVQVRQYEKAHGDRLPIVTMLDNRVAKLATDAAATPSAGGGAPVVHPTPDAVGKIDGPAGATKAAQRTKAPRTKAPSSKAPRTKAPSSKVRTT
ncbi:MAG: hypothetical protein H7233_14225, partial [Pseudorhodobacter sp.]|nr:hypothetical protein [Frankiaceae bacterium]